MNTFLKHVLWTCIFTLISTLALAHKPSDSYLTLNLEKSQARAQLDIALRDLDFAIGLDQNGDGRITWAELRQAQSAITGYTLSRITIQADHQPCHPQLQQLMFDQHVDGGYAVLMLDLNCSPAAERYTVDYRMFFDIDRLHRSIVVFNVKGLSETAVLSVEQNHAVFSAHAVSAWKQWLNFVREGIWHIWMGFDHILFIVSLLLPAVMTTRQRRWYPAEHLKTVIKDAVAIVTAFTLSHSITLTLAALHVVSVPSRIVESCIALSVIAAAFNNIYPLVHRKRWLVTFIFGLIHGFGFASNLLELELPTESLLLSVFGFNVGVEIGQLAIVLVFLPLAFWIRESRAYLNWGLRAGSVLITLIASVWFTERAFNLQLMPF